MKVDEPEAEGLGTTFVHGHMPMYVVIATADRQDLLRRTLESLATCRKPDSYRGTIVVENGPKGGAEEVVGEYESPLGAEYMYVSVGNKSLALNAVLEHVDDCLMVFADDDVRLHPDTLCAYAEAAQSDPCDRFYGGPTGVDYELAPPNWILEYLPPSAKGWRAEPGTTLTTEPDFLGFNWAAFARDLRPP